VAIFEYACDKCSIFWEREAGVGKAPKWTKCPECGKRGNRYFGSAPNVQFRGKNLYEFHTNRSRLQKFAKDGWDKDTADRYYNEHIAESKRAMQNQGQAYARYEPNIEKLTQEGSIKKLSQKEFSEKDKQAQQIATKHFDQMRRKK
jgi:predicted nucleic acid-binding Zn ribbon protein